MDNVTTPMRRKGKPDACLAETTSLREVATVQMVQSIIEWRVEGSRLSRSRPAT